MQRRENRGAARHGEGVVALRDEAMRELGKRGIRILVGYLGLD